MITQFNRYEHFETQGRVYAVPFLESEWEAVGVQIGHL